MCLNIFSFFSNGYEYFPAASTSSISNTLLSAPISLSLFITALVKVRVPIPIINKSSGLKRDVISSITYLYSSSQPLKKNIGWIWKPTRFPLSLAFSASSSLSIRDAVKCSSFSIIVGALRDQVKTMFLGQGREKTSRFDLLFSSITTSGCLSANEANAERVP